MTPDSAHSLRTPRIDRRLAAAIPMPGWAVSFEDGDYTAVRETPLTSYQLQHGAQDKITCSDPGELWLLVDAQTRLAERLTTAQNHYEVGHQRRVEAVRSQSSGPPES